MLPEMETRAAVRWITVCSMIYCVISVTSVDAQESALLLYSANSPPTTTLNNLISIQVDSITLNEIIANSEAQAKVVKKINFRNVNGFAKLVKGESSKFSFVKEEEKMVCDASCEVQCKSIPMSTTLAPQRPLSMTKDQPLSGKSLKIVESKNFTVTPLPYLPPVSEPVTHKSTLLSTTTSAPSSTQTTKTSTVKIVPTTTTQKPQTTTKVSTTQSVEPSTIKTTAAPPRPYIAKKDDVRGPPYLPPYTKKDEAITPPKTSATKKIFSSTKLTTVATKRPTQKPFTTPRIFTARTQSSVAQRLSTLTTTRRSTPGPAYLPLAQKSTVRRSTVTERSYPPATWPSTTRRYTQTFPSWSAPVRRSTEARIATSTGKYSYRAPANSLIYAGEAE